MTKDFYKILGVPPTAELNAIRKAFRRKVIECHPDRGGSHSEMVLVNEAWEILSAPASRKKYDDARAPMSNHAPKDDVNAPTSASNHAPREAEKSDVDHTRQQQRQYRRGWGWGWEDDVEEEMPQTPESQPPQPSRHTHEVGGTNKTENWSRKKNNSASLMLYITTFAVLGFPIVLLIAAYAEFNLYCAAIPIVLGLIVVRHIAVLISGHDDSEFWKNSKI